MSLFLFKSLKVVKQPGSFEMVVVPGVTRKALLFSANKAASVTAIVWDEHTNTGNLKGNIETVRISGIRSFDAAMREVIQNFDMIEVKDRDTMFGTSLGTKWGSAGKKLKFALKMKEAGCRYRKLDKEKLKAVPHLHDLAAKITPTIFANLAKRALEDKVVEVTHDYANEDLSIREKIEALRKRKVADSVKIEQKQYDEHDEVAMF